MQDSTDRLHDTLHRMPTPLQLDVREHLTKPALLLIRSATHRLLVTAESGDVLLVEPVDRLSRLSQADWDTL